MKKYLATIFLAMLAHVSVCAAQNPGNFQPGFIYGNNSATVKQPAAASLTSMFDRAFCSTNNAAPVRISGTWTCLSSANNSVWATNGSGVPALTQTLPNAVQDNITRLGAVSTITSLTGLPTPSVASAAATKDYVDSTAAGRVYHPAALGGTTTVLPGSPTYNNGASGVGATLTATVNGALTFDGVTPDNGDRVLVKNQAASAQNGEYLVTDKGSGGTVYILTRDTSMDAPAEMGAGETVFVQTGSTNTNTTWTLTAAVTTVGTSPVVFVQTGGAGNNTWGVSGADIFNNNAGSVRIDTSLKIPSITTSCLAANASNLVIGVFAGCVASGTPTLGTNSGPFSSQGITGNSLSIYTAPTVKNNGGALYVGTNWSAVGGTIADAYYTMFGTSMVGVTGSNHYAFGWTTFIGLEDYSEHNNQNVGLAVFSDKHGANTNTFGANIVVQDLAGGSSGSMIGLELDVNGRSSTAFSSIGLFISAGTLDGGVVRATNAILITNGDANAGWQRGIVASGPFQTNVIDTSAAVIDGNKIAIALSSNQKIALNHRSQLWFNNTTSKVIITIDGTDYVLGP